MNGRVYEPSLGRFTSPDPINQDPTNSQNFNRYSYVVNNPLTHHDPTGFSWWTRNRAVVVGVVVAVVTWGAATYAMAGYTAAAGGASALGVSTVTAANTVGFTASMTGAAVAGAAAGAAGGFTSAMVASHGDFETGLKGAAIGAVTGGISGGVAGYFGDSWSLARVGTESLVGGINARLSCGDFARGAKFSAVLALATWGNYEMRDEMVKNSAQNSDNINGESAGLFGDGKKLAGARRTFIPGTDSYFDRVSLMGGCQGAPLAGTADTKSSFFGLTYAPGGWMDRINESFAGPHDSFRNVTGSYDGAGNSRYVDGWALRVDAIKNYGLVVPGAPLAAAALIPSSAYDTFRRMYRREY